MVAPYSPYHRQDYFDDVRPNTGDYENPADYDTALAEFYDNLTGDPMWSKPYEFTTSSGQPMMHTGTNDQSTLGEYWANHWNSHLINRGSVNDVALSQWIMANPEAALAAYLAVRPDGTPMLDDNVAGLMEALGLRPPGMEDRQHGSGLPRQGGWVPPEYGTYPVYGATPGGGPTGDPTVPGSTVIGKPGGQLDDVPNDIPVGIAGPGSDLDDVMNTAPMPPPIYDPGRTTRDDLVGSGSKPPVDNRRTVRGDGPPLTGDYPGAMGAPMSAPLPTGPQASTIDPRYPDFIMQRLRRRGERPQHFPVYPDRRGF